MSNVYLITHHPQPIPAVEQTVRNQCVGVLQGDHHFARNPFPSRMSEMVDALKEHACRT